MNPSVGTPRILVVLTSHDRIDQLDKPTGWCLPELAHTYDVLCTRAELVFASPKGGVAPPDPSSVEMFAQDESSVNFLKNHKDLWENTTPLKEFLGRGLEFAAVFYPGGHGAMYDLANDADSLQLIQEFYVTGNTIAAVSHGPIAFYRAKIHDKPLLDGRRVTGFTNREEKDLELDHVLPLLVETSLTEIGADFDSVPPHWKKLVVVDGQIITGQNTASAKEVGEAIARAICRSIPVDVGVVELLIKAHRTVTGDM
ncbi:ThiJ/PfpI family protein [Ophiocordyceps sinensis CO18]|uniref:D-lactate dehydratase n=1 Tax=Ophiocordyceps sinensis (strain Co18 / CGMCC 3.14243) TaxID=911162 RepID=T5A077_OPHSC|nr:ThiJ/PfpI family protein [Ophiocordyceps sinensis CO18]